MDANDQELLDNQDSWEDNENDDTDAVVEGDADAQGPVGEALAEDEAAAAAAASGAEWFVVHSYSGYENKVKKKPRAAHRDDGHAGQDLSCRRPHGGRRSRSAMASGASKRRVFPGYILVQMVMDDESWYVVRHTGGQGSSARAPSDSPQ